MTDQALDQVKKTVLLLGAGHVSGPLIEYLTRNTSPISLIVASALPSELEKVQEKYPGVNSTILLNVSTQPQLLSELVRSSQVVVSLLPYSLHPLVASVCIEEKVHMVTASYFSGPLADLEEQVKEAGIILLNEVGLDPGIDHMLAMDCIQQVYAEGGKVTGFSSYCGGLPAPESVGRDNPLRYKFSWSPRDVLRNTLRAARYLRDGQIVEIPEGGEAHIKPLEIIPFQDGFDLEATPNRDSLTYKERYGIQDACTILRGTLRFTGFARAVEALQKLKLIDLEPNPVLTDTSKKITWRQFIRNLLNIEENVELEELRTLIVEKLGNLEQLEVIEQLGLIDDEPLEKKSSPLETLSHFLANKFSFESRDLVIMLNKISICWPDGRGEERDISLISYGDLQGYSAMAKTVGYTAAIATKMILDGEIKERGCILPLHPEIYRPILARLKEEGIEPQVKSTFNS